MAMTLTRGDDSRLDGAPSQDLPNYADMVQEYAIYLVSQDKEGALYGGDPANARQDAIEYVKKMEAAKQAQAAQRRAAGQAAVMAADAERDQMRASRQGVVPESLPMDEYGNVSARTVRDANLPLGEQEARQAQYDLLVSDEIKALREGRFHGAEAQARQYEQDFGLPTTPSSTGKTDLDYLREQQAHQGFLRTGRGEMIPMGPAPTPESLASRRGFDEWANESPGTERQALYNPEGYEEFREGVRNDIRDGARADEAMYGTGSDDQLKDAADRGNRMAVDQYNNRQARRQSEERVRNAQRGRFYEDKLRVDAGVMPPPPGPGAGIQELERAAFRGRYARRQAELDRRKQNRIDQAMLAGGQPTGGPFGTRATTTAINQLGPGWREIALLDRITNGRRGGATPLDVEAQQMANALPVFRSMVAGVMQDMDPNAPEARRMQRELELRRAAGVAKAAGWDKPAAVREALELQGATPAEINMIMNDLFGPGWPNQPPPGNEGLPPPGALPPPL